MSVLVATNLSVSNCEGWNCNSSMIENERFKILDSNSWISP